MTITVELKLLDDMAGGRCRVIGFAFVMGVHGRLRWLDRDRRGLMATTSPQAVRPGSPSLSRGPRWQSPADLLRAVKAGRRGPHATRRVGWRAADGNQSGAAIARPVRLWAARPLEGRGAVPCRIGKASCMPQRNASARPLLIPAMQPKP